MAKVQTSVRISDDSRRKLGYMADTLGVTHSTVVEMLIQNARFSYPVLQVYPDIDFATLVPCVNEATGPVGE